MSGAHAAADPWTGAMLAVGAVVGGAAANTPVQAANAPMVTAARSTGADRRRTLVIPVHAVNRVVRAVFTGAPLCRQRMDNRRGMNRPGVFPRARSGAPCPRDRA